MVNPAAAQKKAPTKNRVKSKENSNSVSATTTKHKTPRSKQKNEATSDFANALTAALTKKKA